MQKFIFQVDGKGQKFSTHSSNEETAKIALQNAYGMPVSCLVRCEKPTKNRNTPRKIFNDFWDTFGRCSQVGELYKGINGLPGFMAMPTDTETQTQMIGFLENRKVCFLSNKLNKNLLILP